MFRYVSKFYFYDGCEFLFYKYNFEEEIVKIYKCEVLLLDGGLIVID